MVSQSCITCSRRRVVKVIENVFPIITINKCDRFAMDLTYMTEHEDFNFGINIY